MKTGRKAAWETHIQPRLEEIKGWARDGYTDQQMADALDIHVATFYRYKAAKSELYDALKVNKQIADLTVENSLFTRANGCEVTEIIEDTEYIVDSQGKAKPTGRVKRRKIVKQLPPDTTAQIFLLKNRVPEKFRDTKNLELTGKGGGPIETVKMSKRQHAKIREQMLKDDDC